MNPSILALDASSTTIGWCLYEGAPTDHGEIALKGDDIAERCRQAHAALQLILTNHPAIDCVAIESPVARFAKAVIPQARVSGALMAVAALKGLHVVEVAPSAAKRALAGSGTAPKLTMRQQAALAGVLGEHAADALGVALAVVPRVRVTI